MEKLRLPSPIELSRRMALWVLRVLGTQVAARMETEGAAWAIAELPDSADLRAIRAISRRYLPPMLCGAADDALRVQRSGSIPREVLAGSTVLHALGLVPAAGRAADYPAFCSALVSAWSAAGGDVAALRRPWINQAVADSAHGPGLCLSLVADHDGPAHSLYGWYSRLSGHPEIEQAYGCATAGLLVFAVNNPGRPPPYGGCDEGLARAQIERIRGYTAESVDTATPAPGILPGAASPRAPQERT